ncbi:MAG TPA: acyltransferase [Gaiellaceae bacterium]|nr:acyltransferase [Gaiellaceae bacterium]
MAEQQSAKGREAPRLIGIEGLRAIAASSVLVYHVWLYAAPNEHSVRLGHLTRGFDQLRSGVTLFFALSGFLLFRPYIASALRGRTSPALGSYLRNRALRILPAYWFILLFVAVVLEHELLRNPQQLLANVFLVQDYVPGYIFDAGIVPAWSLAIEVVFYLAVPILGAMAIRLATRGRVPGVAASFVPVVVMAAIGFASKAALHVWPSLGKVWTVSFLTHADWFAAGMSVAVLRVLWEDGRLRLPRYWRPATVLAAVAFAAVGIGLFIKHHLTQLEYQTPIAVACGLVLALVVFSPPETRLVRFLTWRPIYAAGLASYSVFLWHDPFVRALRDWGVTAGGKTGFVFNLALIVALTAVLSTLTYLFVEKPALARKRSWQRATARAPEAEPAQGEAVSAQPVPAVTS